MIKGDTYRDTKTGASGTFFDCYHGVNTFKRIKAERKINMYRKNKLNSLKDFEELFRDCYWEVLRMNIKRIIRTRIVLTEKYYNNGRHIDE